MAGAGHPELVFRTDTLLRSINDRLGRLAGCESGTDVPPLTLDWLDDIASIQIADGTELEDARDEDELEETD